MSLKHGRAGRFQDPGTAIEICEPVAPRPCRSHTIAKLKDTFLSPGRVGLRMVLNSGLVYIYLPFPSCTLHFVRPKPNKMLLQGQAIPA